MKAEIFLWFLLIVTCFGQNSNQQSEDLPCSTVRSGTLDCYNLTSLGLLSNRNDTEGVYAIEIQDSNISTLSESQFSQFRIVTLVYVTSSHLTTIEEGAFDGLNLTRLWLSHNDLTSDGVAKGVFATLGRLKDLDLGHNRLTRLEKSWFVNLIELERLDLGHNNISIIADDLFATNVKLEFLKLSGNPNLVEFNQGLPKNILGVHLARCGFHSANFSLVVDKVEEINLSFNEIAILDDPPIWGKSKAKIKSVNLSYNNISTIDVDYFEGLNNCEYLNLDNNRITTIDPRLFRDLGKLQSLNLETNRIKHLCDGTFDSLTELKYLNLNFNQLLELNENALSPLGNLIFLDFRGNSVSKLNAEKLLEDLKQLKRVDLNQNRWSCEDARHIYETFKIRGARSMLSYDVIDVENVHGIACTSQASDTRIKNLDEENSKNSPSSCT